MKIKQKLFFAVISMILLSATALGVPADNTNTKKIMSPKISPVADYFIIPSSTTPLTINFIDQSTGSPTSWSWNFGDKSTSTAQNPVHTYCIAGKYTVTLDVKNAAGSNKGDKDPRIFSER